MFTLYLACLIFGGILLGASLISFGGGESGELSDTDIGNDVDVSHDTEISHTTDYDHHTDLTSTSASNTIESISKSGIIKEAAQFFSFRNLIFFMTFFGLTGTVFNLFDISGILVLIASLGMGAFSYLFGYGLMKYLRNSESGGEISLRGLIGKTGFAGLPITKDRISKAVIYTGSNSREYSVQLSESSQYDSLGIRDKILVIEVVENILIVDKLEV